ncbi:hypothetical protein EVG20_g10592 [Dentipellis fragilis]|uniref:Uncharacterized protein n=1 Tax=Dentipellis fragilis TaxID=205917 RepID=A0A4Y9XT59_9AGAM|nr:hypothetical protein EVG20_g10592 [Dentipellis fragilis]
MIQDLVSHFELQAVCDGFITIASACAYFRDAGCELWCKISQSFNRTRLTYVTASVRSMLQLAAAHHALLAGTQEQRGAEMMAGDDADSQRRGMPTSSSQATPHPTTPRHPHLITLLLPSPPTINTPSPMLHPAMHDIACMHAHATSPPPLTQSCLIVDMAIPSSIHLVPTDTGSQHQAGSPSIMCGSTTHVPAYSHSPPVLSTPRTTMAVFTGSSPRPSTLLCMHFPSLADACAPTTDASLGHDACDALVDSLSPPSPHPSRHSLSPVNAACARDVNASLPPHAHRPRSPICVASPKCTSTMPSRVATPALPCVALQVHVASDFMSLKCSPSPPCISLAPSRAVEVSTTMSDTAPTLLRAVLPAHVYTILRGERVRGCRGGHAARVGTSAVARERCAGEASGAEAPVRAQARPEPKANTKLTSFFEILPPAKRARLVNAGDHDTLGSPHLDMLEAASEYGAGGEATEVEMEMEMEMEMESSTPEEGDEEKIRDVSGDAGGTSVQSSMEEEIADTEKLAFVSNAITEEDDNVVMDEETVEAAKLADEVSEWVNDELEEAVPKELPALHALASEGLKYSRKKVNYREEVLFASLVDFYRWVPRQGRARAAARVTKNLGRGPAFARVLCAQARHFEANGTLRVSRQGRRENKAGLLANDDVRIGLRRWLRTLPAGKVNPKLLQQHMNDNILPSLNTIKVRVSIEWARRCLHTFGYRHKKHSKGIYYDGHERKSTQKRRTAYLAEMKEAEKFRATYAGQDMAEKMPILCDEEKEHVWIFQDEAAFHSNDFQNVSYWLKPGEQVLKKKTRGTLMMVSGFICERYGNLALPEEMVKEMANWPESDRLTITNSRVIVYPTSKEGGDSYWNAEQMATQARCSDILPCAQNTD